MPALRPVETFTIAHDGGGTDVVLDSASLATYIRVKNPDVLVPPLNQPGGICMLTVTVAGSTVNWRLQVLMDDTWTSLGSADVADGAMVSHGLKRAGTAAGQVLPSFAAVAYRVHFASAPNSATKIHVQAEL